MPDEPGSVPENVDQLRSRIDDGTTGEKAIRFFAKPPWGLMKGQNPFFGEWQRRYGAVGIQEHPWRWKERIAALNCVQCINDGLLGLGGLKRCPTTRPQEWSSLRVYSGADKSTKKHNEVEFLFGW